MSHPNPNHDPENVLPEDNPDETAEDKYRADAYIETLCGKPHNNGDDDSTCLECQLIKHNI